MVRVSARPEGSCDSGADPLNRSGGQHGHHRAAEPATGHPRPTGAADLGIEQIDQPVDRRYADFEQVAQAGMAGAQQVTQRGQITLFNRADRRRDPGDFLTTCSARACWR